MQHSNSAHCLADDVLGALNTLAKQMPDVGSERAIARHEGAKAVIDAVVEVIDRHLPAAGQHCICPSPAAREKNESRADEH